MCLSMSGLEQIFFQSRLEVDVSRACIIFFTKQWTRETAPSVLSALARESIIQQAYGKNAIINIIGAL